MLHDVKPAAAAAARGGRGVTISLDDEPMTLRRQRAHAVNRFTFC
jgi:hypothetical protein